MITYLYDYITKDPTLIHSSDLISQLGVIEKKASGKISAASGHHDDLFMASSFCAYLKKQCQLEISPLINIDSEEVINRQFLEIQQFLGLNTVSKKSSKSLSRPLITDVFDLNDDESDDFDETLPFWYSN